MIFPPDGWVFELIHRCRTVAFREGMFGCLAIYGSRLWAVGLRGEMSPANVRTSQWHLIDPRCHEVSLLHV